MLAGCVVLGPGVAGTMILATTCAADLWQGGARLRYLGLQGAAMSAGGTVAIPLGGMLATLHWRGAFLAPLPVMLVGLRLSPPAPARRGVMGRARGGGGWKHHLARLRLRGATCLFMATLDVMPTRMPFRLAEMGVTSPLVIGPVMASMTTAAIPGALGYRRLRRRLSVMDVLALSWTPMAAGLVLLA